MFTWAGSKFDAILNTYVLNVVSTLMTALAPLALSTATVWVLLFGWSVLRGEVNESVPVFLWKTVKLLFVLAFALESGFYISNVADSANSLAMGVATTFLPASADPATVTTPYVLLDRFNDSASTQVADIMKEASMFRLDLLLAAVIFSFGSVAYLCMGLYVVTLSKVLLTFVIAIGPIFILSLAWRPTARYFDSWLSMLLSTVVMTWFVFFALGLSTYMGNEIFRAISEGGGFLGPTFNVLGESTRYCVLMLLLAILCFQAPTLAAALTGGAAVQQGIQMLQNALMVSGLRSAAGRGAAGATGAGGVVRPGTGIPYAAGRAAGETYGRARIAAYRLAAMRGQR